MAMRLITEIRHRSPAPGCAYCGRTAQTRDHVVPKQLWPSGSRPRLILTVPACAKCNQGFKKDEDYFNAVLQSRVPDGSHPAATAVFEGPMQRNFEERPHLLDLFFPDASEEVRKRADGAIEEFVRFRVYRPRIERVLSKMVRGFYYHLHGVRFPNGLKIVAEPVNPENLTDLQGFLAETEDEYFFGDDPPAFTLRWREADDVTDKRIAGSIACGFYFYGCTPYYAIAVPRARFKQQHDSHHGLKSKRNSLCNCGSGKKYKRCCGGNSAHAEMN